MSSPNTSEGTRKTIENKAKTDKITFICIRSDLRFFQYVRFFYNFRHKYPIYRKITVWELIENNFKIKLLIWNSHIIF